MNSGQFFHTETTGSVVLLDIMRPVGSLSDAAVMRELDQVLANLRASHSRQLVVDFHQTPYFGSSMLEALRLMWNVIHSEHGQMVLCNLSEVGREIMEVSKFDHLWPIFADRDTALSKLRNPA